MKLIIYKIIIIVAINVVTTTNACAIEFDVWRTGISLAEMVSVAKSNDIPIIQKGVVSGGTHFNKRVINDLFYDASMFQYFTELLGKRCMVFLLTTDDKPKWLYEIEVSFAGAIGDKSFGKHLLTMLEKKYGPARKELINYISHHVWYPDSKSKITLQQLSQPKINYIDLEIKNLAQKQRSYQYQDKKHGYSNKDSGKF